MCWPEKKLWSDRDRESRGSERVTETRSFSKRKLMREIGLIKLLKDDSGHVFTDQKNLECLTCEFYQHLFTALEDLQPDLICSHVPQKIMAEMGDMLVRP